MYRFSKKKCGHQRQEKIRRINFGQHRRRSKEDGNHGENPKVHSIDDKSHCHPEKKTDKQDAESEKSCVSERGCKNGIGDLRCSHGARNFACEEHARVRSSSEKFGEKPSVFEHSRK